MEGCRSTAESLYSFSKFLARERFLLYFKAVSISKTMEITSSRRVNFLLCRNNVQPQELGDCDLCVEFAHFMSTLITLERKKKLTNQTIIRCLAVILLQMHRQVQNAGHRSQVTGHCFTYSESILITPNSPLSLGGHFGVLGE